ncbi:MAG: ATP-binding protein [Desulfomonilaceae bacterium]|nr:ATP-binding protein [Desulfomonilaceae bacterium]
MKEIVIISGKGGTGKTTLTASFAYLARDNVLADCDVDAADLHLLAAPKVLHEEDFYGGVKAVIDPGRCTQCGLCTEACRYAAISDDYVVDPLSCEGCSVCFHVCPVDAVTLEESLNGRWFISESRLGPMVHAELRPGEENSGKLVALVRNQAKVLTGKSGKKLILVDGAPGVGCPVISSVTGADRVVIVTEPTRSGIHDMLRALELVQGFNIPTSVVINKYDIAPEMGERIHRICSEKQTVVLGSIPYDAAVTAAMVNGRSVVEFDDGDASKAIVGIWEKLAETVPS